MIVICAALGPSLTVICHLTPLNPVCPPKLSAQKAWPPQLQRRRLTAGSRRRFAIRRGSRTYIQNGAIKWLTVLHTPT